MSIRGRRPAGGIRQRPFSRSPTHTPEVVMMSRYAVQVAAAGAFAAFVALPTARAAEPPPPVKPAISEEAATAVSHMGKTLLAHELSFTAKTIRVYQDEAGQPLHISHTMNVVVRRPDRLAVQVTGDDGSQNLFYDGKSVFVSSPDHNEYAVGAASGDIPSALNKVMDRVNVDFPLVEFFTNA